MEVELQKWQEEFIKRNYGITVLKKAKVKEDKNRMTKQYIYKKTEMKSTDGIKYYFEVPFFRREEINE